MECRRADKYKVWQEIMLQGIAILKHQLWNFACIYTDNTDRLDIYYSI